MRCNAIIAVLGFCVLASGCKMTRVCNSAGGMEIVQSEGGVASVSADDCCFSDWLVVESSALKRTTLGFPQAVVQIRNVKEDSDDYGRRDDFVMQYRFTWFDAQGAAMIPDSAYWMPGILHGGEAVAFSSVAPDKSAVKFVFRARHAR